jgi:N-acetylglucosaminyldiphosphoundecaprenol N-acetyl-beta-D-mannosaminyltransferase
MDATPAVGVECFAGDLDLAAAAVVERALSGDGGYACPGNVHCLVSAVHDPALRRALDDAWLVYPDGSPVAWLQRRAGYPRARRIAGPDLMTRVFDLGQANGLRHYLYGSTAQVLERLTRGLSDRFPNAIICGSCSPPFAAFNAPEVAPSIEAVRPAKPHIVWCGLGVPKQELWMQRYAPGLAPALALGVGAAFDFLAGTKQRAPRAMQRLGLEWLYRLAAEPQRLSGRYLRTNSEFVALLGWELLCHRRGK